MKILAIAALVLFSALFIFSPTASAVNIFSQTCSTSQGGVGSSDVCKSVNSQNASGTDPILKVLRTVILLLSYIIGVASVIVIIIASIQMITGGDAEATKNARNMMIYALVGIFVAALAQVIVVFVLDHIS